MALITKLRNAQTVLAAVFEFNWNDTMVNTSGTTVDLGAVTAGSTFNIITPPVNAIVVGGTVKNITPWVGPTACTIDIGDSDDTNRYTETAAIDRKDPDAPATGFDMLGDHKQYSGSQAISMTLINSVAVATAGKTLVTINFVVPGRASENVKTT